MTKENEVQSKIRKRISRMELELKSIENSLFDCRVYFGDSERFMYDDKPAVHRKLAQRKKLKRKLRKLWALLGSELSNC